MKVTKQVVVAYRIWCRSATEDGTQSVTLTITEDDSAPTSNISTLSIINCRKCRFFIHITATLSIATTADVTVALSTSGTGTEGTDYGTISDITISAGTTTGTASFTPTDDSVYEGNETGIVAYLLFQVDQLQKMELNQLQ